MSTGSIFDSVDALRLVPDAAALDETREVLSHVPIRKPNRTEFVRAHPDDRSDAELVRCWYSPDNFQRL